MQIFETEATRLVDKVIERARARGRVSLIYGQENIGKTEAVRLAMARHPYVSRVELPPAAEKASPRGWFAELAGELGLEPPAGWTTARIVRELVARVNDDSGVLVIDQAVTLRSWQLDCLRYLADRLGHLVLAGGPVMLIKALGHAPLRAAVRMPCEVKAPSVAEVQNLLGDRFSADFLARLHALRGGRWGDIATVVENFELRGDETRGLTAEHAEEAARRILLGANEPDVVAAAARRAA